MTLRDRITDAIASEDRREWLSPDEVAEMVDDVVRALATLGGDDRGRFCCK